MKTDFHNKNLSLTFSELSLQILEYTKAGLSIKQKLSSNSYSLELALAIKYPKAVIVPIGAEVVKPIAKTDIGLIHKA